MWSNLEKAAKKAAGEAGAAAKKITKNPTVKQVRTHVKIRTKQITESEPVQAIGEKVLVAKTERLDPLAKKLFRKHKTSDESKPNNDGSNDQGSRNTSNKHPAKIEVDADGDGDMSEITWIDGSVKRLPNLRVFGKDTRIVVTDESTLTGDNDKTKTKHETQSNNLAIRGGERSVCSERGSSKVHLPILCFHGIASAGLRVEESGLDDGSKYKGRRLWVNTAFLAAGAISNTDLNSSCRKEPPRLTAPYVESVGSSNPNSRSVDEDDDDRKDKEMADRFAKSEEEFKIRSAWLYHIALDANMVDERPGNRVRPYDGIKGCDYLMDDPIGKTQAAVFAETIRFLVDDMGYVKGKNVDAACYDWRLPPSHTEARDGYLTKTMERVERMYQENDNLPVILVCHSMGCKMAHYFLNFCLKKKGREWIDRHIHTYMPIGAPHCGGHLTIKLGATGAGLLGFIDDFAISLDEGLIMYRSWGSGPWLMPREIPKGVFPPCIVRREGELGISIGTEIDVGPLFTDRSKPPRELRLTIVFRDKIRASTEFVPLAMGEIDTDTGICPMVLKFEKTFYLAVPYLEHGDDLGSLKFYLEEPSGRLYLNHDSSFRQQFGNATKWARGIKKGVTKVYRNIAKKVGTGLRVAVCERPLDLKPSSFCQSNSSTTDGLSVIESIIRFRGCRGDFEAQKILHYNDESTLLTTNKDDEIEYGEDDGSSHRLRESSDYGDGSDEPRTIVELSIQLTYSPPPDFSGEPTCTTKFAVIPEDTPPPPVVSRRRRYNTIEHDKIVYDNWNGRDLLDRDGFCGNLFDLYEEYYEQDPLGPTTRSALDPPPVNCVRAIYGINVPTEISCVYRKEPVVTIGDGLADCRYRIDTSATFPDISSGSNNKSDDQYLAATADGYHIKDGIISEIHRTLQNVPGTSEQRRCCGDGTVPYWSLVHCLNWKGSIPVVTADELEGAVHRSVLDDKRFHALLNQYCTVDDPRSQQSTTAKINTLAIRAVEAPGTSAVGNSRLFNNNPRATNPTSGTASRELEPYVSATKLGRTTRKLKPYV